MAGNSRRRGAMRKEGTKKGMVVGSGGQRRRALQGKGPTPPAELRKGHPAARRAAAAAKAAIRGAERPRPAATRRRADGDVPETVLGRNPVVECLRAGVPATALHVALGSTSDERVAEAVQLAADAGLSIQVPPYAYAHPDELLEEAAESGAPGLIVALDGVTDPRNLGAVVRSVGAFGGHGVVVPQRRAAGQTAVPWGRAAGGPGP